MKIAICFYGQPRRYKQVLDQWYKIITELNADIFIDVNKIKSKLVLAYGSC
jgi:hypothetical protein